MKLIKSKWKRDRFQKFGKWWEIFYLVGRYEVDRGKYTEWLPVKDNRKRPITFIPVAPFEGRV